MKFLTIINELLLNLLKKKEKSKGSNSLFINGCYIKLSTLFYTGAKCPSFGFRDKSLQKINFHFKSTEFWVKFI